MRFTCAPSDLIPSIRYKSPAPDRNMHPKCYTDFLHTVSNPVVLFWGYRMQKCCTFTCCIKYLFKYTSLWVKFVDCLLPGLVLDSRDIDSDIDGAFVWCLHRQSSE